MSDGPKWRANAVKQKPRKRMCVCACFHLQSHRFSCFALMTARKLLAVNRVQHGGLHLGRRLVDHAVVCTGAAGERGE